MANKDDYLTDYRQFFEHFKNTLNPNEQLPVKLGSYKFINHEVVGGIIDWTSQYLNDKQCPKNLISHLIKIVIDEVRKNCKKDPTAFGFNTSENAYEPLKLMQSVILQVNEICLRYLDNSMLCSLPSPGPPYNIVSYHAIRNSRRRMEDRHAIVHDLNTIFSNNESSPSSYYAIFDGHAGHDAAAYSAAHLHQYLAESKHFASNPENALIDAFCKTDLLFLEKCKIEHFSSGTTAVCALLRPKEKNLYIAWVGDSQAVLAKQGLFQQCVNPHKPNRPDERLRIESKGGCVRYWGTFRVNGQLAISRAIGDSDYKPYITAEPEVREFPLDGTEDFLVIACDGLWDVMQEHDVTSIVYNEIYNNPETVGDTIAHHLTLNSKERGSTDNISVIVVFLREPTKIAAEPHWEIRNADEELTMEAGFDNTNASSNPFANSNGAEILASQQKEDFLLDLDEFRSHAAAITKDFFNPLNGKNEFDEDDDEDLGPETDVDAVDDVQSPVKSMMSDELEEKVAKEIDANLLKSVAENCNADSNLEHDDEDEELVATAGEQRKGETPTPPADEVHDAGLDSDSEEDEWNYIKGAREEGKENIDPAEQFNPVEPEIERALTFEDNEEIDNMSQLNPNAEEFVPVSPTRALDQPICAALKEEQILAQSPRRATQNCDFNVPEEQEFEEGVKKRPSEFFNNGHENGHKQSSQEIMENLLNGKHIQEIEFQPVASPTKVGIAATENFIFGPNSAFSTPGKFMDQSRSSTKANYGDESALDVSDNVANATVSINPFEEEDLLDRLNKEKDPMSMSFYQDKGDDDSSTPFDDLNKVHDLPTEEEEKHVEQDQSSFNDSISDLPEHNPHVHANDIITTDLDKREDDLFGVCELPKSPIMANNAESDVPIVENNEHFEDHLITTNIMEEQLQSPSEVPTIENNISSDIMEDPVSTPLSPAGDFDLVEEAEPQIASAPMQEDPQSEELFETDDEIIEHLQEPLVEIGARSPMPEPIPEEVEEHKDEFEIQPTQGNQPMSPEPIVCYASREAELFHQEAASEEVSASSDLVQQQEFIPETSHEVVAQSPEPVVIDYTPVVEPQICSLPVVTSALIAETPSPSIEDSAIVEESFETKVTEVEIPIVADNICELSIGDVIPTCEEAQIDEITSSVKDDSPLDEIKEDLVEVHQSGILESPIQEVSSVITVEGITPEKAFEAIKLLEESIADIKSDEETNIPIDTTITESSLVETAAAVAAATAAAVTTVTIGAGVIAEAETKQPNVASKTKPATATATKKSTSKTSTTGKPLASTKTSASKTAAAKPTSTAAPLSSRSMPTKSSTTKSTTGAASARAAPTKPRPGTASTTAAKSATEKKPLTNGDVKPAAPRPAPIRRPQPSATTKPAAPKPTTAAPTAKPPIAAATKTAARPAPTTVLKTTASKPLATTAAPKTRPSTLATSKTSTTAKTTATAKPSSTTATTRTSTTKTNSTTAAAAAKPKTTSAPASKPRVPLTNRTATARAPDAEKQNKENVNKLTASRTAAASRTAMTRKVDAVKTTVASKTSVANKPGIKKTLQKTTNSVTAAKSKEEKIVPNGVSGEKESSINEADLLLKDLSPVSNLIIDNSQVAEATAD